MTVCMMIFATSCEAWFLYKTVTTPTRCHCKQDWNMRVKFLTSLLIFTEHLVYYIIKVLSCLIFLQLCEVILNTNSFYFADGETDSLTLGQGHTPGKWWSCSMWSQSPCSLYLFKIDIWIFIQGNAPICNVNRSSFHRCSSTSKFPMLFPLWFVSLSLKLNNFLPLVLKSHKHNFTHLFFVHFQPSIS